jgi:hypothetical protein
MTLADFGFPLSAPQFMRDPLQWPQNLPADAMVFSTHETEGFHSAQDTSETAWPDTGATRRQVIHSTQNGSESTGDTVEATSHARRVCTNAAASYEAAFATLPPIF